MNLETCVLNVSAHVLLTLRREGCLPVDALSDEIRNRLSADADPQLPAALALLFLLGRIEYADEADAVVAVDDTVRA